MNKVSRLYLSICRFLIITAIATTTVSAQSTLSLNVGQATDTINKAIYSGLLEQTSTDIYNGLYVGTSSTIPNVNGMRKDIIAAFKESGIVSMDWPGGCAAESYIWADGIGPKSSRTGGDMTNGMGTAEYFQLCDSVNSVPYITADLHGASVAAMTAWLHYIDSLYPNRLKYWKMGNEPWGGCGVTSSITQYIASYNQYKAGIPASLQGKLFRIADGGSGDYLGRPVWIDSLMLCEMGSIEGATFHYYGGFSGAATGFPVSEYYNRLSNQWLLDGKLKAQDSIMTRHDPNYTVGLMVDEWGLWYSNPNQSTCRDAIAASMTFNMFNNRCKRIKMAGVAQPVNFIQPLVITKNPPTTSLVKTPTLYVFKMYKVHQQAKMVPSTLTTSNITSGSDVVPFITSSSSVDNTGKLHISLCNTHATSTHTVAITLNNAPVYNSCTGTIINGPTDSSYNKFDVAETVNIQNFTGATLTGNTVNVTMPAHSVVTLELTPAVGVNKQPADRVLSLCKIYAAAKGQLLFRYSVAEKTSFSLDFYTFDGRMAGETFKGILEPGKKELVLQPKSKNPGANMYIVKLKVGEVVKSQCVMF